MKALQIDRKVAKFAAARVAGLIAPGLGGRFGPLELTDVDPPELPGPGWQVIHPRLAGICGSDLSTIDGVASRYFEPIVSFPFTPGHEVVADAAGGRRVVLEPVLGCVTRGLDPVCAACARGDLGNCERLAFGVIDPGLQTGFCCDTGGGWGASMIAHESQLHDVPEGMGDEDAVLVEPTACAVHAALRAGCTGGETVVVLGAGTLGLLTVAALRHLTPVERIIVAARYPHQIRVARELGADATASSDELARLVRSMTGSMAYGDQLTGGCDVVIDCVGDSGSLAQSLAIVKPRGRVVVVGMPANVELELTTLWHRETELVGAYAYGTEHLANGDDAPTAVRTFDLAFRLAHDLHLGRLLTETYRLTDYRAAIEHAAAAGRRGAVKIAFDLRNGDGEGTRRRADPREN
jgi:threonine dehydrogenase-like Zn-dependent dehydrogenase